MGDAVAVQHVGAKLHADPGIALPRFLDLDPPGRAGALGGEHRGGRLWRRVDREVRHSCTLAAPPPCGEKGWDGRSAAKQRGAPTARTPIQAARGRYAAKLRYPPPRGEGLCRRHGLLQTIQFAVEAGIARLTLNRPDRLNSFTVQMHEEVADALGESRRCADSDPHRRGPWLLRGAGSERPGGGAGRGGRSRRVGGAALQSADPDADRAADAGDRAGERRGGRRRGQYRFGLRHRHRGEERQVHPELRRDRADSGQRRAPGCCRASSARRARSGWR